MLWFFFAQFFDRGLPCLHRGGACGTQPMAITTQCSRLVLVTVVLFRYVPSFVPDSLCPFHEDPCPVHCTLPGVPGPCMRTPPPPDPLRGARICSQRRSPGHQIGGSATGQAEAEMDWDSVVGYGLLITPTTAEQPSMTVCKADTSDHAPRPPVPATPPPPSRPTSQYLTTPLSEQRRGVVSPTSGPMELGRSISGCH